MCASRVVGLCLLLIITATPAWSADWANALFTQRTHNFGTVARAAATEHVFEFTNTFDQPLHISSVRASCGCTTPIIVTETVLPGETGQIKARFNTRSFTGQRGATVTVVFDRPSYGEAQLRVDGYVRRDVVCNPGQLDLGTVCRGSEVQTSIDLQYAGRGDWQIVAAQTNVPGLQVSVEETQREGGRVGYQLHASFAATNVGYVQGHVELQTNDARLKSVPINVSGKVLAPVTVSPQNLVLGQVRRDASTLKKLILKGEQEFRIQSIECDYPGVTWELPSEAKKLHIVPIHLQPGDETGQIQGTLRIQTDCEAAPVLEIELSAELID